MSNHRSRIQRRGSALAVTLVSLVALALLAPPAAASPQWSDWSAPVWLGATINSSAGTVFLYFNSNKPGGLGSADIYVAVQQPDGSFGAVANVTRLNSPFFDARATISHDGLEVIFNSNRATGSLLGQVDLWSATRESTSGAWSTPTSLTALKTAASDYTPYLSADHETLYFASDRAGGLGAGDLWVSTRTKSSGKP